jgi:hypothetical protein
MLAKRASRGYQAPRSRYTTRQCAKVAAAGVSGGWRFFAHPV